MSTSPANDVKGWADSPESPWPSSVDLVRRKAMLRGVNPVSERLGSEPDNCAGRIQPPEQARDAATGWEPREPSEAVKLLRAGIFVDEPVVPDRMRVEQPPRQAWTEDTRQDPPGKGPQNADPEDARCDRRGTDRIRENEGPHPDFPNGDSHHDPSLGPEKTTPGFAVCRDDAQRQGRNAEHNQKHKPTGKPKQSRGRPTVLPSRLEEPTGPGRKPDRTRERATEDVEECDAVSDPRRVSHELILPWIKYYSRTGSACEFTALVLLALATGLWTDGDPLLGSLAGLAAAACLAVNIHFPRHEQRRHRRASGPPSDHPRERQPEGQLRRLTEPKVRQSYP